MFHANQAEISYRWQRQRWRQGLEFIFLRVFSFQELKPENNHWLLEMSLIMIFHVVIYVFNNFSSFSAKLKFSHKRQSLSMLTNEVVSFLAHRALLRLDHF